MRKLILSLIAWGMLSAQLYAQSDGYGLFNLQITNADNQINSVFIILPLDNQNVKFKSGKIVTDYYLDEFDLVQNGSITFYNSYNYILYPICKDDGDQIISLQSPRIISNIVRIKRIRFIGMAVLSDCLLQSHLTIGEIAKLNSKPKCSRYSDRKNSRLYALDYSGQMDTEKVDPLLREIHANILAGTINCNQSESIEITSAILTYNKKNVPALKQPILLLINHF